MSKIIKSVENGANVIMEIPDGVPRIFADGFGPALIGFPLTTVTMFQQEINEPTSEFAIERRVIATIQVPTVALLELAQNIQNALRDNKGAVEAAFAQMSAILDKDV